MTTIERIMEALNIDEDTAHAVENLMVSAPADDKDFFKEAQRAAHQLANHKHPDSEIFHVKITPAQAKYIADEIGENDELYPSFISMSKRTSFCTFTICEHQRAHLQEVLAKTPEVEIPEQMMLSNFLECVRAGELAFLRVAFNTDRSKEYGIDPHPAVNILCMCLEEEDEHTVH
jgi:hypothetical protein